MKFIAHRGLQSQNTYENTYESVLLGMNDENIDGIEVDIRLTKDNEIIVFHDMEIDRVCNGSGLVKDMTLEEIRNYKLGNNIINNKLITLEELLQNHNHNKILIIEFKDEDIRNNIFVEKALLILNRYSSNNIYLQSFSKEIVELLKNYSPYKTLMLVGKNNKDDINVIADGYSINSALVNRSMITNILKNGKDVFIWTIDDIWTLKRIKIQLLGNMNNIHIITNVPYVLM